MIYFYILVLLLIFGWLFIFKKYNILEHIQQYPKSIVSKKQIIYKNILDKTVKALKKYNIPVFLSSGTALGYFREGKFLDHDYDIDVGIFAKDYTPDIINSMKEEGLILYRILGDYNNGMELSFRLPNTALGKHAKIDIFLHYFEKDTKNNYYITWYTYAAPTFTKKIKYRVNKFKIKEVIFKGIKVFVPFPTLNYIEQHYGDDWMIPKKPIVDYIYHKSPISIVNN